MNLKYLRYIVHIAQTGSITKSAEQMLVAQPNLSNAVRDLEAEIGITIFSRTPRGVTPTADGEEFLTYARSILRQVDQVEQYYQTQRGDCVRLNIAAARSSRAAICVAHFVGGLEKPYQVHFNETTAFGAINDVVDGTADFGIIKYSDSQREYFQKLLESRQLSVLSLTAQPSCVLLSACHPLAQVPELTAAMLEPYPEIVHGDFKEPLTQRVAKIGTAPNATKQIIYVYDRGSLLIFLSEIPTSYLWTTATAPSVLKSHGLIERTCTDTSPVIYETLIYSKTHPLSGSAKELSRLLVRTLSDPL